jgi:hypothetical protein
MTGVQLQKPSAARPRRQQDTQHTLIHAAPKWSLLFWVKKMVTFFVLAYEVQRRGWSEVIPSFVLLPFQIISRSDFFLVHSFCYIPRHIIISRCVANWMYQKKSKRLIIWNGERVLWFFIWSEAIPVPPLFRFRNINKSTCLNGLQGIQAIWHNHRHVSLIVSTGLPSKTKIKLSAF